MSEIEKEPLTQEMIDEFVVAAHHDLPKVQAMLAQHPALLNESATWFETPVEAAAHTGQRPIAEFLLGRGAPLDICTAAMLGLQDEVTAMLNDDPKLINATGAHDIPLLFFPVIGGNQAILELLVQRNADVNAGAGGNTALHAAAGSGHLDMVKYLLDQGADFTLLDYNGRTPLDVAIETGHEQVADFLRSYSGME